MGDVRLLHDQINREGVAASVGDGKTVSVGVGSTSCHIVSQAAPAKMRKRGM